MRSTIIITAILSLVILILAVNGCRDRKKAAKLLTENERLLRENRDLRNSLTLSSRAAQQISDRRDIQQQEQAHFVDRREYFRRNWKQYISLNTGDYRTGFLGGIRDLKVAVRNQTEYPLDNVVIAVQYLRSNGEVFKTEQYTIHNIPAKGVQSVTASDSRKGSKVQVRLISITSQAMNFCWSHDKVAPPGNPDPFVCAQ